MVQNEEFDISILNAPKQKFKVPYIKPTPFSLEGSNITLDSEEESKEYESDQMILDLSQNSDFDIDNEYILSANRKEINFGEIKKNTISSFKLDSPSTNTKDETNSFVSQHNLEGDSSNNCSFSYEEQSN